MDLSLENISAVTYVSLEYDKTKCGDAQRGKWTELTLIPPFKKCSAGVFGDERVQQLLSSYGWSRFFRFYIAGMLSDIPPSLVRLARLRESACLCVTLLKGSSRPSWYVHMLPSSLARRCCACWGFLQLTQDVFHVGCRAAERWRWTFWTFDGLGLLSRLGWSNNLQHMSTNNKLFMTFFETY